MSNVLHYIDRTIFQWLFEVPCKVAQEVDLTLYNIFDIKNNLRMDYSNSNKIFNFLP